MTAGGIDSRVEDRNPKWLMAEEYKSYIEANADTSSRLAALIGDFQDYGNTKQRLGF